ncbi:collagen alpha-1(I) chain-like [Melozone crissalis]|uniref:collagen alpha-1(I) chain-like n=1 Tax=Melozone crissalis TaxID=40204 RepID=UPI0023DCC51E|nr:collagen alpha-1(I) chain-like [Melozone crissalis]
MGVPWVLQMMPLWEPQVMPTGASLGAPGDAHGCPSGCPRWCSRVPRRVPRAVPTNAASGARPGAPGDAQGAPLGAPGDARGCPVHRYRSGYRVPRRAPRAMPGGSGMWSRAWGTSHPWAKSGKRTETAPKRRRGGSRPDRASHPNQKSRRSASAPPAAPAAFSGGPRSPGPGAPPPRSYILLVRRILAFASPQPIHTASAPGPRAGAGPPAPPAPPGPAWTPRPPLASLSRGRSREPAGDRTQVGTGHGWGQDTGGDRTRVGQPRLTREFGAAAASSASHLASGRHHLMRVTSPPGGVTSPTSPVDRRWPKLRFTLAVPTVPKHCPGPPLSPRCPPLAPGWPGSDGGWTRAPPCPGTGHCPLPEWHPGLRDSPLPARGHDTPDAGVGWGHL